MKTAKEKAGCKALTKPVQDRALRGRDAGRQRTEGRRRKPLILTRAFAWLLLLALTLAPARAAYVVTGAVNQVTSQALDTYFMFMPWEDVLLLNNGLSAGPAKTVQSTNGALWITLDAGSYLVRMPRITGRNAFTIAVPNGTGTANITNLIALPWTYQDFINTVSTNGSGVTNNQVLTGIPSSTNADLAGTFTGSFTGDAAGATNFYEPFVSVSSRGIANGLSTVPNAGADFGPDTIGTATSGLQEAYNARVAGRTDVGPGIITVPLVLDGGDYFLTNTLVVSNLFTTDFSLEGFAGMTGSRLIAAGTNSACLIVRGGFNSYLPSSLTMPLGVRLNGVTFASVLDDTNALVTLTNNFHVDIENCNFTSWMVMTNQDWGSGNSIVGNAEAPAIASSLVGLVTGNGGENGTHIVRCNFGGLGVGVVINSDHIYMSGTTFSLMGMSWDGNGTHTSKWPTNHPYSSGAAIIRHPGLNSHYTDPYFYSCRVGLFVNYTNSSVDAEAQYLDNPIFEGVDYELATTATNRVFFYTGGPNGITPDVPTSKAYVNTTNGYSMNNSGRLVVRKFVYDNNGTTPFASIYATKFESPLFAGGASGLSNLPPAGLAATNTGTAGQAYHWLTSSTGYWATVSGSGTPGGANTQVQFNDAGSFGGDGGLTYNKTTDTLTINGGLLVGAVAGNLTVGGDISFDGTNYGNGFGLTDLNAANLTVGTIPGARLGGIGSSAGGFVTTNGSGVAEFSRNAAGLTNYGGVKTYKALLSQSGTAAPTATVVNNTLGGTVTLARSDVGTYTATLTGAFTVSKTLIRATASAQTCNLTAIRTDANTITFKTFDVEIVGLSDDMLTTASFEILVYP